MLESEIPSLVLAHDHHNLGQILIPWVPMSAVMMSAGGGRSKAGPAQYGVKMLPEVTAASGYPRSAGSNVRTMMLQTLIIKQS